jgi:hypothetical protein
MVLKLLSSYGMIAILPAIARGADEVSSPGMLCLKM